MPAYIDKMHVLMMALMMRDRSARLVWLTQQDRGGDHDSGSYRARFWARQRPTRASLAAVGQV
jgi:hypothetical protein